MTYATIKTPDGKTRIVRIVHNHEERTTPVKSMVDQAGNKYERMIDGSIHRVTPRPYRGKSGRRQWKLARRLRRRLGLTTEAV